MVEKLLENELTTAMLDVVAEMVGGCITLASAPFGRILYSAGVLATPNADKSVGTLSVDYADHFQVYTQSGALARNADLPLVRAIRLGKPVLDEVWMLGRPGADQTVIICDAWPLRNARDRVVGGLCVSTDGTHWARRSDQMKVSIKVRDLLMRQSLRI
ncbi:hypothetical protein BH10PSE1_BH10PSE1_07110 [soil metagenome]